MTITPWPRYVGRPTNADTLSPSLTAKARAVEQHLGITLELVQGSPSYSGKSGGTHAGPGNAADWRSHGLTMDRLISRDFREMQCISFIRGRDVDRNGADDDNFDPHLHVIDYTNRDALTPAQRDQLDDYLAGRDGLVGDRRDREPRPTTTYPTAAAWLATKEELPMDQTQFNKLMTGWAKSNDGRTALQAAIASTPIGRGRLPDGRPRTLATDIQDLYWMVKKGIAK